MNKIGFLMGIVFMALSPFFVYGQLLDPVDYRITNSPETAQAGEIFSVEVEATIEGDWHLYSVLNDPDAGPYPTTFSSGSTRMAVAGQVEESEAVIAFDPNFQTELGWHSNGADFKIPVAFRSELEGEQTIVLEVLYQVCDDVSCLPPKTKTIEASIVLDGVAENPYTDFEEIGETEELVAFELTSSGGVPLDDLWGYIWIAITAGLAALLTPCVFPLIPLTVSYFSNQGSGQKGEKKSNIGQALIFGLSIILIFTGLGAILSVILGVSGVSQFASNPWVNLFIGMLFIFFGVSLLGLFELRLPYQLTNWLNRKSNESGGVTGTLFMGFTISAVSFSCTAPFVGAILAATAGGEWFYPIVGMLAFSTAFALPFVLLALFPSYLESLPKSGSWMNVVKVILGFVILAASIKFLANADIIWDWGIVTRPLGIAAWITFFLLAGFYILGFFALHGEERPKSITTGRLLLAIPFLLFSLYLTPGMMGASLGIWDAWLPASKATDVSVVRSISSSGGGAAQESIWSDDYDASVEKAIAENRPIFIDFTGYTCTNCRAMESTVFPLENIQDRFSQMENVKLYTDGGSKAEENQQFQFDLTGTLALPTYVIVDPHSGQVLDQLIGFTRAPDFEEFLNRGIERYRQVRS
ncbi:protein-disulfide reductase DsbD family protein [Rhodohalobacter halophilus]|uniref:protein-disulfide reductase DsbD family protein n=1 Tax=Rhodohalobacter halophilus TaxID=1812810 RepID=UPI00083F69F7|nr:cytochrome c biogenesis protein CcdA [Rhodohalobacter halophilus]